MPKNGTVDGNRTRTASLENSAGTCTLRIFTSYFSCIIMTGRDSGVEHEDKQLEVESVRFYSGAFGLASGIYTQGSQGLIGTSYEAQSCPVMTFYELDIQVYRRTSTRMFVGFVRTKWT